MEGRGRERTEGCDSVTGEELSQFDRLILSEDKDKWSQSGNNTCVCGGVCVCLCVRRPATAPDRLLSAWVHGWRHAAADRRT